MEWMAELDEEVESDADFYRPDHEDATLGARLFLIMSNRAALDEMLRLWASYQASPNQQFSYGFDKWRRLFEQLRSLRVWGYEDRLRDTGLLDDWRSAIQNGREYVSFEAELWYRGTDESRRRASAEVEQAVIDAGGQVFTSAVFSEISYHGLLGQIPSAAAQQIIESQPVRLLQCEEIMFVRPAGQTVSNPPEDEAVAFPPAAIDDLPAEGSEPRVALLDGLPLGNHGLLAGRLQIDDPDDWQADYLAAERNHGTAMASLIVHGDLGSHSLPLRRPVYVRPIMKPDPRDFRPVRVEAMPHDRLSIDLLHTAVRRLFETIGGEAAIAPSVRVINISIGDPNRPLDGPMSPFARMIDWLTWRYRVLFVISAGNAPGDIALNVPVAVSGTLTPVELARAVARGIHDFAHLRKILSPAESINAITIGALHSDDSGVTQSNAGFNPYPLAGLPSPINTVGLGFKRGVKPDVLIEGGLQLYRYSVDPSLVNAVIETVRDTRTAPGQQAAAPGGVGGALNATRFFRGTSNAAALGSRGSALLVEMLETLKPDWQEQELTVLAKALLAHASSWGDAAAFLSTALGLGSDGRDHLSRYLGYGSVELNRVLSCEDSRVTVISAGEIADGEGHVYTLPLPPTLSGKVGRRRIIVTLAWLSPTNALHRDYRRAALWFQAPDSAVSTVRNEGDWRTVQRGTLQHEIFEGDDAVAFVDGATLNLKINCRADAGKLEERVPYAIAVTLEAEELLQVPVYEEVRARLRVQVPIVTA